MEKGVEWKMIKKKKKGEKWELTIVEYKVCQYSARCDSHLLRKKASRVDEIPFAIHVAIMGG